MRTLVSLCTQLNMLAKNLYWSYSNLLIERIREVFANRSFLLFGGCLPPNPQGADGEEDFPLFLINNISTNSVKLYLTFKMQRFTHCKIILISSINATLNIYIFSYNIFVTLWFYNFIASMQ